MEWLQNHSNESLFGSPNTGHTLYQDISMLHRNLPRLCAVRSQAVSGAPACTLPSARRPPGMIPGVTGVVIAGGTAHITFYTKDWHPCIMGYMKNHLATVSCGAFAVALTILWPLMVDFAPVLNFVFIMSVPIAWFLTLACWLSQKSVDYVHNQSH
ncbi:hypothetical protein CENSYa_1559 [Cenarchaeum symbiosum A]|uniref:Uncharacterized protein n=1 Tax=Cenarchaeum symbiosum (strain A) TaxID=414004 RepID=A0RXW2_CENSY|nr:hypothetical protein CENSYa_1559 [Cenarchaeum symbiosum A]